MGGEMPIRAIDKKARCVPEGQGQAGDEIGGLVHHAHDTDWYRPLPRGQADEIPQGRQREQLPKQEPYIGAPRDDFESTDRSSNDE